MKISNTFVTLLLTVFFAPAAKAQNVSEEIIELRNLVAEMQQNYEQRIGDLEARLSRAERSAGNAQRDADEAVELAEQTAIDFSSGSSAANTFNPAIGAILIGQVIPLSSFFNSIADAMILLIPIP